MALFRRLNSWKWIGVTKETKLSERVSMPFCVHFFNILTMFNLAIQYRGLFASPDPPNRMMSPDANFVASSTGTVNFNKQQRQRRVSEYRHGLPRQIHFMVRLEVPIGGKLLQRTEGTIAHSGSFQVDGIEFLSGVHCHRSSS